MSFTTIAYDKAGHAAFIRLNRPEVLNAYNVHMRDELFQAFEAVRDDGEVRVLVISGEGRAFCVGGDVGEFGTMPPPVFAREIRWQRDVWGVLRTLRCPTIAAMHGYAVGSGLELALYCDLRVGSDDLVLSVPEIRLGMIPPAGGTQTTSRAAGIGVALDMLLTARRLNATEALRWRLLQRVVPKSELMPAVQIMASKLAVLDPFVVETAKRAVRASQDLALPVGLALERRLALLASKHDNNQEKGRDR